MRVTLGLLASALCVMLITGEAFGMAWGSSRHGRYDESSGSGKTTTTSVPEPSSLYAIGSALAVLGGAGWFLRRK